VSPLRTTDETKLSKRHKVGVLPVVFAILVAAGLVVLIAWQAAPWLTDSGAKPPATDSPPPAAIQSSPPPPAHPPATSPEERKPSPMLPASESKTETAEASGESGGPPQSDAVPERGPLPEPPPETSGGVQSKPRPATVMRRAVPDVALSPYLKISVSTIPADATAMLDNRPDQACTTPCALDATPGQHIVTFSRSGYQTENRSVTITDSSVELVPIALRVPGGTLMLASVPAGAKIFVNGAPSEQITPAQLELRPGKYNITVEKDGKRSSKEVEIENGRTGYEKMILQQ
jgi:hypothetical protein